LVPAHRSDTYCRSIFSVELAFETMIKLSA
jgi:hypothetical protein